MGTQTCDQKSTWVFKLTKWLELNYILLNLTNLNKLTFQSPHSCNPLFSVGIKKEISFYLELYEIFGKIYFEKRFLS